MLFALGVATLVMFFLWRSGRRRTAPLSRPVPSARSSQSLRPLDAGGFDLDALRSLRRTVQMLENELNSLRSYFVMLPDLTKEINALQDKRKVAPLMITMLEQIFDPQKILIFYASERDKLLYMIAQKGFQSGTGVSLGFKVPYGHGRIGWVAQHRATMQRTDFDSEMRLNAVDLNVSEHRQFDTELCAPMLLGNELFGVISVGGITRHPRLEKRMLDMVADMGSLALNKIYQFNRIAAAANTDGLTRLHNKQHFMVRFSNELLRAQKSRNPLSVFIFDIDHFKKYNDAHGHQAGDECLKLTAKVVRESLREEDIPGRYGGEEFIILFPNTHRDGALLAAEKVRRAIETKNFTPPHPLNPNGRVTISGGVATFPDDALDSAGLIRKADEGLYEAKHQGRNRITGVARRAAAAVVKIS